jgi:hypothetical protein
MGTKKSGTTEHKLRLYRKCREEVFLTSKSNVIEVIRIIKLFKKFLGGK